MTHLKNHYCKFYNSQYKQVKLQAPFTDEPVLPYFKFMLSLDLKCPTTAPSFIVGFKHAQTTTAAKGILELHFSKMCDEYDNL